MAGGQRRQYMLAMRITPRSRSRPDLEKLHGLRRWGMATGPKTKATRAATAKNARAHERAGNRSGVRDLGHADPHPADRGGRGRDRGWRHGHHPGRLVLPVCGWAQALSALL